MSVHAARTVKPESEMLDELLCLKPAGRVGGGTQSHIPDHELTGLTLEALNQFQLTHVKGLRLGAGPNNGMKGFSLRQGMDAVGATGEFHNAVA